MPPRTNTTPTATGQLGKTPFAHLVVFMMDRKLDGSIVLVGGDGSENIVVFSQGAPAKARTSYQITHLGRVLLEIGLIDLDSLNHSLEEFARRGGLHGEMLVSLGLIDRAQLAAGLREQLMRRLVKLFECLGDETSYTFYKDLNLLDDWGGNELTPIDPLVVLWAGVRSRPSSSHIEPTLSRIGIAPLRVAAHADFRRFQFGDAENAFLDYLRARPASVSELLASRILPERQLKVVIYALLISHQLDIVRSAEPVKSHPQPEPEPEPPSSRPRPAQTSATSSSPQLPPPSSSRSGSAPQPPNRSSDPKHPSSSTARNRTHQPDARGSSPASPAVKATLFTAERQAFLARSESIGKDDYFTILGVAEDAPFDVVQAAYFALAKKWHPDRLPPELADLRDLASKIFARMSEAAQTLTDPEKRKKYIENKKQGMGDADEQEKVNRIVEAAFEFQKADILIKKRDFVQAEALARKASEADPGQADYIAVLAWCMAQQPERQKNKDFFEPLNMLNEAIKLQEKCERAYFYRASLLSLIGKPDAAARDFRKSIELNPRNVESARQLRIFEMRKSSPAPASETTAAPADSVPINWKQDGVGTIFGKLFKK